MILLNIIQFSSMIDPHFKRKIYNVSEQLEKEFFALTITLNQGDQDSHSQSQIRPTEGQEYANLSTISNMPSTSSKKTVASNIMDILIHRMMLPWM